MKKIIISACILGENCKYNGSNNLNSKLIDDLKDFELIPICPEVMGGLTTPRVPAEINGNKVINREGIDVTKNYQDGAMTALKIAKLNNVKIAILKAKSPSCGNGEIYDGSFSHKIIKGNGITANLFEKNNIKVFDENNYIEILKLK